MELEQVRAAWTEAVMIFLNCHGKARSLESIITATRSIFEIEE